MVVQLARRGWCWVFCTTSTARRRCWSAAAGTVCRGGRAGLAGRRPGGLRLAAVLRRARCAGLAGGLPAPAARCRPMRAASHQSNSTGKASSRFSPSHSHATGVSQASCINTIERQQRQPRARKRSSRQWHPHRARIIGQPCQQGIADAGQQEQAQRKIAVAPVEHQQQSVVGQRRTASTDASQPRQRRSGTARLEPSRDPTRQQQRSEQRQRAGGAATPSTPTDRGRRTTSAGTARPARNRWPYRPGPAPPSRASRASAGATHRPAETGRPSPQPASQPAHQRGSSVTGPCIGNFGRAWASKMPQ